MTINPKIMTIDPDIMQHKLTSDPKIMQNKATNFKITGPQASLGDKETFKRSSGNHVLTI